MARTDLLTHFYAPASGEAYVAFGRPADTGIATLKLLEAAHVQ